MYHKTIVINTNTVFNACPEGKVYQRGEKVKILRGENFEIKFEEYNCDM